MAEPPSKKMRLPTTTSDPAAPAHTASDPAAPARRVFPPEIIFNVLTFLPVKSVLRFKDVSPQWRRLASFEEFKSAHLKRAPNSIIIRAQSASRESTLYSCIPPSPPVFFDFPGSNRGRVEIIGTQNGIVCLSLSRHADRLLLWNPATGDTRPVPSPTVKYDRNSHRGFSIGLGYDESRSDIVIVRIIRYIESVDETEIFSVISGRWEWLEEGDLHSFHVTRETCDAVIKGQPYWTADVGGSIGRVVVTFNHAILNFDVHLDEVVLHSNSKAHYGEIMGVFGAVVWEEDENMVINDQLIEVWVMNPPDWKKVCRVQSVNFIGRVIGIHGERGIVQENADGSIRIFDFETNEMSDVFEIQDSMPGNSRVIKYKESFYRFPIESALQISAPSSDSYVAGSRFFPRAVIMNILSYLPVASVHRLSSVSEEWRKLVSLEEFKFAHLRNSPSSLLIFAHQDPSFLDLDKPHDMYTCTPPNQMSVLSYPGKDDDVVEPHLMVIGSTPDGIVCLTEREYAEWVILWNPATGLSKVMFPQPEIQPDPDIHCGVSIGLAYDQGVIIVRVICHKDHAVPDIVEIYSLVSGKWTSLESNKIGQIRVLGRRCETLIGGVPYWRAVLLDPIEVPVVAWFDPKTLQFSVAKLDWEMKDDTEMIIGEIRGHLGAVVWNENKRHCGNQILEVWQRTADDRKWVLIHQVGPLNFPGRVLGMYGGIGIVQEIGNGSLYLFNDPDKFEDGIRYDGLPIAARLWLVAYKPSLISIPEPEARTP